MVVDKRVGVRTPELIKKRDGRLVPFDANKIAVVMDRCFAAGGLHRTPDTLVQKVLDIVKGRAAATGEIPTVEGVQDIVEFVMQANGYYEDAKHYILYRADHARLRDEHPIPEDVRAAFQTSDEYFPTQLQKFQFFDKYSRFNYDLGRRETWVETVGRLMSSFYLAVQKTGKAHLLPNNFWTEIERHVLTMRAMPSMRRLAMSGDAYERDNATQYNCTYLPADGPTAMVEAMLLGMAGCGVGYSVESQYVEQWPRVMRQRGNLPARHVVEDSTEGWGEALQHGLDSWLTGFDITYDFSQIRPAGSPLRTKGGRSSGPGPLREMLTLTRDRILPRQGSTLRTIDVHDLMCMSGRAAISGGVRRTAQISIFDADDLNLLHCKDGDFERENSQRWNANNSAVVDFSTLTQAEFMRQWTTMVENGRGEPGIFSRETANRLMPGRRPRNQDDGTPWMWGSNPCGEIILRPWGMCNLTTVKASKQTLEELKGSVAVAAWMGVIQSLGTHFPYLRPQWKKNCEEERLLGVSIGGQMDNDLFTGPDGPEVMSTLQSVARKEANWLADLLGINRPTAITCVKPDGNSSQLLDMSSGIHPRWAPYYIRNVRMSATSPLAKVMRDAGVPMSPENGEEDPENPRTWVVSFPVKAPAGAITRGMVSAIHQCEFWLQNKEFWTEHNPSVTITYDPHEVIDLMKWVWDHRYKIGGMAFLPKSDAKYDQLPYIEIDQAEYEKRLAALPEIDFSKVYRYESDDRTTAAQEVACLTGVCEVET